LREDNGDKIGISPPVGQKACYAFESLTRAVERMSYSAVSGMIFCMHGNGFREPSRLMYRLFVFVLE
jgi:hypothetical protein